jgi:predicted N-formylglutamate amidohydrolase
MQAPDLAAMDLAAMDVHGLPPLLGADEPPPVEVVNADSDSVFFFICDHASNRIPRVLGDLGLGEAERCTHIGWDIGAAALARLLAGEFRAPLVLSGYSRLVIDCNRPPASTGSIPETSAGIEIAANRRLGAAARRQRLETLFNPYHEAIAGLLDARMRRLCPTAILAIHSFTPDYPGETRPWQVDFAYHRDRRLAGLLIEGLVEPEVVVGDNLPYMVEDASDHSIPVHGEQRGLPHVLVEIRQDGLMDPTGIGAWARRFTALFRRLEPDINRLAKSAPPTG